MPIFDAHIHFSHDAAEVFSAGEAVALLEQAGLKRALVSSSGDAGTRALYAAAPELVLPSLRPYRRRGEIGTWVDDPSVIDFLEDRLTRFKWVAGRRIPPLRPGDRQGRAAAHDRAGATSTIFSCTPIRTPARSTGSSPNGRKRGCCGPMPASPIRLSSARCSGSTRTCGPTWPTAANTPMAARSTTTGAACSPPSRTASWSVPTPFTPERWHYVAEHADWTRQWLADLPRDLAERIAWRNGEAMIRPHLAQLR